VSRASMAENRLPVQLPHPTGAIHLRQDDIMATGVGFPGLRRHQTFLNKLSGLSVIECSPFHDDLGGSHSVPHGAMGVEGTTWKHSRKEDERRQGYPGV